MESSISEPEIKNIYEKRIKCRLLAVQYHTVSKNPPRKLLLYCTKRL